MNFTWAVIGRACIPADDGGYDFVNSFSWRCNGLDYTPEGDPIQKELEGYAQLPVNFIRNDMDATDDILIDIAGIDRLSIEAQLMT